MTAKDQVLAIEPTAYLKIEGSKRVICRPRTKADLPALVHYILLSDVSYTSGGAWENALKELHKTRKST